MYTPRQVLEAAARSIGEELTEGVAILTGTPAGVAFRVPRWKRMLGERFLDPIGKLGAAIDLNARSTRFLRAGDTVSCDGGPLGTRTVRLTRR